MCHVQMVLTHWHKIGVVMKTGAIDTESDGAPARIVCREVV